MPTRSSRYWNRGLMPYEKEILFQIKPHSCRVITLHEKLDRPQVISTNRHITQGGIDLENVSWEAENAKLSGVSKLVKNDDYELVITLPVDFRFEKADVEDGDVAVAAHIDDPDVDRYNTVKVKMKSPANKKVKWAVLFKEITEKPRW